MASKPYSLMNSRNPMHPSSRFLDWETRVAAAVVALGFLSAWMRLRQEDVTSGQCELYNEMSQSLMPKLFHSHSPVLDTDVGIPLHSPSLFSVAHTSQLGRHKSLVVSRMSCSISLFTAGIFTPECPRESSTLPIICPCYCQVLSVV